MCWVVLFWRLGHTGLIGDEAHYARLTLDMAAAGDWLVPRLGDQAFIDKPVFFHWVQGLLKAVVPRQELAARLPSALAAVALFGLIGWFAARSGNPQTGRGAWLMLATLPATFMLGRTGYMDMLFTVLLFGTVVCCTRTLLTPSRRMQTAAVVFLALAVLTKGPTAAALVAVWLGVMWLARGASRQAMAGLRMGTVAMGVAALATPWFLWMYFHYGDAFVQGYFGLGHAGYLAPRASASSSDWTFYARMFMTSFFPWSFVAVGYGVDTLRRWRRGTPVDPLDVAMWLWIAVVLLVFTMVPFRVDRYIYPAAPACCVLAVRGWWLASADVRWREFAATRAAVALIAVAYAGLGATLWWSLPRLGLALPTVVWWLPAVIVSGGLAIAAGVVRSRDGLPRLAGWPVMTLLAIYAAVAHAGLPLLRTGLPIADVGRFIAKQTVEPEPVAILGLDRWEEGLGYYLRRSPQRLQDTVETQSFAQTPGPRWIVTRRKHMETAAPGGCLAMTVPAIVGTTGRGIRTQVWDDILVIRFGTSTSYVESGVETTLARDAEERQPRRRSADRSTNSPAPTTIASSITSRAYERPADHADQFCRD